MPKKGGFFSASLATMLFGILLFLDYNDLTRFAHLFFNTGNTISASKFINIFAVKGITFFLAALVSALFGVRLSSTEAVLTSTIINFDQLSLLYKTIFDNINTGIITINNLNVITSANNAAQNITGFALDELIGFPITTVFPSIDLNKEIKRRSIDFVKNDGTHIRIGYTLTPLSSESHESDISSKFGTDSGLITLQDISEIEKLERKIRQGEKMMALGMMSASIAHDFRNPLAAISGSAQVLAKELHYPQPTFNQENLELTTIILRESNKLIDTISDFLKFARPDIMERDWFSLRTCIEEVLQVCRANPRWPRSAYIEIIIENKTDIWADEKQFSTVMNHLIQNGIAFCPMGEEHIRITAEELVIADEEEKLIITVEDNGPGIEKVLYDKIFEPFYTNRADGTGLGLAIVKQTIEGHKGTIEISKSDLGGAKFTVTLPLFLNAEFTPLSLSKHLRQVLSTFPPNSHIHARGDRFAISLFCPWQLTLQ